MHSTIHAVCGQQKGKNRAKSHVIFFFFFFLVKRAGRHFGFFKRAGRHEKGAGRRALQKKPRQNTVLPQVLYPITLRGISYSLYLNRKSSETGVPVEQHLINETMLQHTVALRYYEEYGVGPLILHYWDHAVRIMKMLCSVPREWW